MKKLFVNKSGQIRSGWKIGMVMGTYLLSSMILTFIAVIVFAIIKLVSGSSPQNILDFSNEVQQSIRGNSIFSVALNYLDGLCMIGGVYLIWRVFDKKRMRDIGMTGLLKGSRDFVSGLLLGILSISAIFFVLLLSGNITLSNELARPDFSAPLFSGLLLFVMVGFKEEIFSRGYCMVVLRQTGKRWVPMVVSSVIFSLLHGLNPNVSIVGLLNIFLVGMLFAYMFEATGNIWMPIGYHITWNYFQGNIFGFPVSGMSQQGLYNITVLKENLLTGGNFGPEGGLLATTVIALGFVVVKYYSERKSRGVRFRVDG